MKRRGIALMGATLLTLSATITSFAGSWKQDNVGWWYQRDNGSYPSNGWEWVDGNNDGISECYYFNEAGYMLANTTTPDGYQVDSNGAWLSNGVVQTKNLSATPTLSNTNISNAQITVNTFTAEQILSMTPEDAFKGYRNEETYWGYDYLKTAYELGLADKVWWKVDINKNRWITIYEDYIYNAQNYSLLKPEDKDSFDAYVKYCLRNSIPDYIYAGTIEKIENDVIRYEQMLLEYEPMKRLGVTDRYVTVVDDVNPLITEKDAEEIFERCKKRVRGYDGLYLSNLQYHYNPRTEDVVHGVVYVTEPSVSLYFSYTIDPNFTAYNFER